MPEQNKYSMYFSITMKAIYETVFVLLPVAVWILVIMSFGGSQEEIKSLSAWPFACLALFCAALRDGISAFHQDNPFDKRQREILVIGALVGVVFSTVLLTISILKSRGQINTPVPNFQNFVYLVLYIGIALLFVVKATLIQRKEFGKYNS